VKFIEPCGPNEKPISIADNQILYNSNNSQCKTPEDFKSDNEEQNNRSSIKRFSFDLPQVPQPTFVQIGKVTKKLEVGSV